MLRKVSVIALLMAAASATASADRWRDRDDDRDRDRDAHVDEGPRFHRLHINRYRAERRSDIVAQFDQPFDTRDGRGPVVVDLDTAYPIRKLVLDSTGNSEVFSIIVQYADGTSRTFAWNHVFNAATSDGQAGHSLVMNLDPRPVRRVLINGYNAPDTRLSVLVR